MAYVSNLLTHWVGSKCKENDERFEILMDYIVKDKLLLYSYNNIPFGSRWGGIKKSTWGVEMICFTDIPLSEAERHCDNYSNFGISFSKSHLTNCLVFPVWYTMSPLVHKAYSYLFHSFVALKPLLENASEPIKLVDGCEVNYNNLQQHLSHFISMCQDYSSEEYPFDDKKPFNMNCERLQFFEDRDTVAHYYFEREWRSVRRNGDGFAWNVTKDGRNYFKFQEDGVEYLIVPKTYIREAKKKLLQHFSLEHIPSVLAYEDLKFL